MPPWDRGLICEGTRRVSDCETTEDRRTTIEREGSMVASETKCAHDGCDCIGTDEFCSDFCLAHGAGEHTNEHAAGGVGCGCGHAECGGAGLSG